MEKSNASFEEPERESSDPEMLLEWLAPITYHSQQAEFARRRHPGSLQWLLDSGPYQRWVHAKSDSDPNGQLQDLQTLYCPGPAGAGKTVLASAVVQDLGNRFPPSSASKVGIAYIYCVFHLREEQFATNLLLVLLHQLLPPRPLPRRQTHDEVFGIAHSRGEPPSLANIAAKLEEVINTYDRVFFVLDALDECAPEHRIRLLEEISKLQAHNPIHLLVTSDFDPDIAPMFVSKPSLEIRADQDDLRLYLERCIGQLPAFVRDKPDLQQEINEGVTRAANGRFLLAMLHVQSLAGKPSPKAVRTALASLTTKSNTVDYDGAYDAVMWRIENQPPDQAKLAKKALSYILCATSPLTVLELCHALAVKVGDTQLDRLPHIDSIISACAGLVFTIGREQRDLEHEVDKTARVRLVHRTTYDYLQRKRERWLPESEKQIATACMTYLSLGYFDDGSCFDDDELERRLRRYPLYCYAALRWGYHARAAFSKFPEMGSMDFDLLASRPHIESACQVFFMTKNCNRWWEFPHCMNGLHLAAYFGIANLVRALCLPSRKLGSMNITINAKDGYGRTALALAAHEGHEETVRALLEVAIVDLDVRDGQGRTPISLATEGGHASVVEILLDRGANPNFKDFFGATPLWYAVKEGYITIVDLLVRNGVNVNMAAIQIEKGLHTPLSLAAMHGYAEIVRLLLIQLSIQSRSKTRSSDTFEIYTPMRLAMKGGHYRVVEMLLSYAHIDIDREMLLHEAAEQGDEYLVQLLLRMGTDVNTRSDKGDTPLHYAVRKEHDAVATLLLSHAGVLPDLINDDGDTPASLAARWGRAEILRLLLEKGANSETRNKQGHTLLCEAAEEGYLSVVELLLASDGVDADSRDHEGRTPLSLAISQSKLRSYPNDDMDHRGVIRCLLDSRRVDVNCRDAQGLTPLAYAVNHPSSKVYVVEMLLECEYLNVNTMDEEGRTPLSQAVRHGLEDVTKLLLRRGADPYLGKFEAGETLLSCAAKQGNLGVVMALLSLGGINPNERDSFGHTPLCRAVENGHTEVAENLLIAGGLNVNVQCDPRKTSLHHAAETQNEAAIAFLLAVSGGRIPLHDAAGSANDPVVTWLLEAGIVDPNREDLEGHTPLSLAARGGFLPIVERLLSLDKVILDARDNTERAPLSWAVEPRFGPAEDVMKRLLQTDSVDPNAEDEKDWTPLLLALKRGDKMVVDQLRAAGARLRSIHRAVGECDQNSHEVIMSSVYIDGEDGGQQEGVDTADAADDAQVCEDEADEEKDGDGTAEWLLSEQDPLEYGRQRKRQRLMESNWFNDETEADSGSDWSGTNADVYERSISPIATHIELGVQVEEHHLDADGGDQGDEEPLCEQCKAADLDALFSQPPAGGFRLIAALGQIDESWESRQCAMCRLIATVRPGWEEPCVDICELCAYSSTATWLSRGNRAAHRHLKSRLTDTVFLGLEGGLSAYCPFYRDRRTSIFSDSFKSSRILPFGFIGRVGSNGHDNLRSLTVHRLQADAIDFKRARGWIDCCMAHHGRRCKPSTRRRIPYFRLIDCTTRDIVDGRYEADQFIALSYVWGPSPSLNGVVDDRRVGMAERVVEDAIHATSSLGYRYLWVDRHCIANEKVNPKVRKEQLLHMNAVYENAEATIVAAAGQNSTFGLPGVSRARIRRPCVRVQGHVLTSIPCEPRDFIRRSIWWTRGWTYQEGLLSRRRLMFTEHEISYECQGMVARESVELPMHIHRIAATRYPLHEHARVFPRRNRGRPGREGDYIWSCINEYTERRLTLDTDILNAMLGIMQVFAERKLPVYNLCGIPLVREKSCENPERILTLLEAFGLGLCWSLKPPGIRRKEFPSWSWTGWKGRVHGPTHFAVHGAMYPAVLFDYGHSIKVSMVSRGVPSQIVSWAEFEALSPEEKANIPQDCRLEITATTVETSLFKEKSYDSRWKAILYNGDDVFSGKLELCKDPAKDIEFYRRLTEERWLAIVIGYSSAKGNPLILLLVDKVGNYWERVGVIKTDGEHKLNISREGCTKRTFLLE